MASGGLSLSAVTKMTATERWKPVVLPRQRMSPSRCAVSAATARTGVPLGWMFDQPSRANALSARARQTSVSTPMSCDE